MSVRKVEVPETMPTIRQDKSIESDTSNLGKLPESDSSQYFPHLIDSSCGTGGFFTTAEKVTHRKHNSIRNEAGCHGYWRAMYGRDAEIASRGGVAWL